MSIESLFQGQHVAGGQSPTPLGMDETLRMLVHKPPTNWREADFVHPRAPARSSICEVILIDPPRTVFGVATSESAPLVVGWAFLHSWFFSLKGFEDSIYVHMCGYIVLALL